MVLKPAVKYQRIAETKGVPRRQPLRWRTDPYTYTRVGLDAPSTPGPHPRVAERAVAQTTSREPGVEAESPVRSDLRERV